MTRMATLAVRRLCAQSVIVFMASMACGLPTAAISASMHVAPLRLDLGPQRPVASMVIGNPEQEEFAVQAEVVAWSQENGRDVYTPTRDVLINPSIFRIPAGGQQIVRVGLQVGTDARERSYRVFVRQLPQERAPGQGTGLQTLLRIGIPVFVAPAQPAESLDWNLRMAAAPAPASTAPAGWELVVDNKGSAHVQITSIVVRREGGEELLRRSLSHYVLSGSAMAIAIERAALPALAPDTALRIEAVAAGDRALPPIVLRVPHAPPAAR